MNILLTGGMGYIGTHAAAALCEAGMRPVIVDNLSNSNERMLGRLVKLTGVSVAFERGDIRDFDFLQHVLMREKIDAVMHFAGLKAVDESVKMPLSYYSNNIKGAITLLEAMESCGIRNLVFSSSATVYGIPQYLPLDEDHPRSSTNPYGRTKLHIEEMLEDVCNSKADWRVACLRYFNPVGAHESGLIGESPSQVPNNIMPYLTQVAKRILPFFNVYGADYDTRDGTGVRDYIHVSDLADGHVAALRFLNSQKGWHAFNLGTGKGISVLELIGALSNIAGVEIPYKISPRRKGDVAECFAICTKARDLLDWRAVRDIQEMCASAWRWQINDAAEAGGSH